MAPAAPKRERSLWYPRYSVPRLESLKQLLVQQIASGNAAGAETTRAKLRQERMYNRVRELEAAANSAPEASTVHWVADDGNEESIEMTATPEAKAYFEELAKKETGK